MTSKAMTSKAMTSRVVGILAGVALLAAAYAVTATIPTSQAVEAPFASRGVIGDEIVSQHLIGTVNGAALANEVELDLWRGTTNGIWFVADTTLSAMTEPELIQVDLFLDGVRYPSSSRGDGVLDESSVDAGFASTGPILVELPADVLERPGAREAVLRISTGFDARLDSVIEVVIDLTQLDVDERVELESTRTGAR